MLKATAQNDKLKCAIILSLVLHCILIAVLIWSSIHQPQETIAGGGSSIEAVKVDPVVVVQQYNRQQQAAEQQRLKALEKQRLAAQESAYAQQSQPAKQQKQAEEAAKQAQVQQKQVAVEAKKQAEAKAKKATAQKEAAATTKKAAASAAKRSSDVDTLLGGLTDAKNTPKAGGVPAGTSRAKQNGASGVEIDDYNAQVSRAISNKFYDASSYSGRTCDLRIKLAPDGLLISVNAIGGDPALCQAAVSAAKMATIPRPPSPQVYEVFKNATLGFSPQ